MTIFELLRLLDANKIHFSLASFRDGAVTAQCTVPGERWEIEVFEDGSVEFEVFNTAVDITGESEVRERIKKFSD